MPTVGGLVVISIDAVGNPPHAALGKLLRSQQIAATWVVSEPRNTRLEAIDREHEIALATTSQWVEQCGNEAAFAQQLLLRTSCLAKAGFATTTLATDGTFGYQEVARNSGISLIRPATRGVVEHHARLLRSGLCQTPNPITVPTRGWWQQRGLDIQVQRELRRVSQTGEMLHVEIESGNLDQPGGLKAVSRMLTWAAELRRSGKLQIGPVKHLLSRIRRPVGRPQCSVLRAA